MSGTGCTMDAGLRVALDANFPNVYYQDVRIGAEWRWRDLLALRAGYRRELDAPADLCESGSVVLVGVPQAGGRIGDEAGTVGGASSRVPMIGLDEIADSLRLDP